MQIRSKILRRTLCKHSQCVLLLISILFLGTACLAQKQKRGSAYTKIKSPFYLESPKDEYPDVKVWNTIQLYGDDYSQSIWFKSDSTIDADGNKNINKLNGNYRIERIDSLIDEYSDKLLNPNIHIVFFGCSNFVNQGFNWSDIEIVRTTVKDTFLLINDSIKGNTSIALKTSKMYLISSKFLGGLDLSYSQISSKLSLKGSKIEEQFTINESILPDSINLENLDLSNLKGEIDLTKFESSKKRCFINLYKSDVNKIKLNYSNFQLYFPDILNVEDKSYIYQQLLNKFKTDGFQESYKLLDIEYQRFKYVEIDKNKIGNFIAKYWWNYSYDKSLVLSNSIKFFIFFYIINFIFFRTLLLNVYTVPSIESEYSSNEKEKNKLKYFFRMATSCLLYTGFVFWGFKINVEKIKTKKFGWVIYLLLQYIIGIVCLAYLANIVLSK